MTADDPRPAGEACDEPLCTTTLPHHVHSDAEGRSWCCGPNPYTFRPAASGGATDGERWGVTSHPEVEAQFQRDIAEINAAEGRCAPVASQADGEPFNDDWWTALYLATSDAADRVPYAAASEYPVPHAAAFRAAVEPFLRQLLADAAAVRTIRAVLAAGSNLRSTVEAIRRTLDGDQ